MKEHMEARGLHHVFSNTLQVICLKQGLSLNLELTNLPILPEQQAVGSPHFVSLILQQVLCILSRRSVFMSYAYKHITGSIHSFIYS